MANVSSLAGRLSFIIKASAPARFLNVVQARSYSMYPPYYIKPTYKKSEQDNLRETGEAQVIAHTPILPAFSSNTSSEFHDHVVQKFTNYIMRKGKKKVAREELNRAFTEIKRIQLKRYHISNPEARDNIILDPIEILYKAVKHATPVMQLNKMKRGGVTYQVPVPILENRQRFLGMNWLIKAAQDKPRTTSFWQSLARELVDAAHNQGRVVKKKLDLHKQCEANRAYAHYRWS